MADDLAEQRSFAESQVLSEIFGTEDQFQAMVADEISALTSSALMLDFLKKKAIELGKERGGQALRWVSSSLLRAVGLGGGPGELEQIRLMLTAVLENQKLILQKLETLLLEVKFQHLVTRGFESVKRIEAVFERLENLARLGGRDQYQREAETLNRGILATSDGMNTSLRIINDVLLGRDQLGESDPLIRLFADRWFPVYTERQAKQDVSVRIYPDNLEAWLHGLFFTQYMGLVALANARIANEEFGLLEREVETTVRRMDEQRALLAEEIPEWTRRFPESLFDGRSYVVKGLLTNAQTGNLLPPLRMFGAPPQRSQHPSYLLLQGPYRVPDAEMEWVFERADKDSDTFFMRTLSGRNVALGQNPDGGPPILMVAGTQRPKLRFMMAEATWRIAPNAKRRDRFHPIIVFAGTRQSWTLGGRPAQNTFWVVVGAIGRNTLRVEVTEPGAPGRLRAGSQRLRSSRLTPRIRPMPSTGTPGRTTTQTSRGCRR